jgi:prepilin-type N-terminal cleavage/methylation domain-containing protein
VRVASGSGFSIIEVMVAVAVLTVGVLALVGSAALTSRMLGSGRQSTRAGQVAAARIERLRQVAFSTAPACTSAEWRGGSAGDPSLTESWQILDPAGPARRVLIVLRSRRPAGLSIDTVVTGILCGSP